MPAAIMNRERDVIEASKPMRALEDQFGRRFPYIRLSLTDVCNFSCNYCLPNGYKKPHAAPSPLTVREIERLVRAFASLGVWKIRLTGGEPTIRPEFIEIARAISRVSGIRKLAVTTNGYKLPERALSYREAGINAINISIDTLDPAKFAKITGHDRLDEILSGIDACKAAGFESIKINAVLMKGLNDQDLDELIGFVAKRDISLRFIELMRTNDNVAHFEKYHVSSATIIEQLIQKGWQMKAREPGAGPANEFTHRNSKGRVGIIAPYAEDFCASCNRLRISSMGKLHLCLFGDGGYDLRPLLQSDAQQAELMDSLISTLLNKVSAHKLHEGNSGATPHLASIGG